jgi:hypothetical protein
VTTVSSGDAFARWRSALLDALGSADGVVAWQDRRYRFAYEVGQVLIGPGGPDGSPITGAVVYGVYVAGAGLLYVGQTGDARRRLRDLLVGESHYLATTVPPETWERVVVVKWPGLLASVSAQEARAAERLGPSTCGLALEHMLQMAYRPVLNAHRRGVTGGWSARNLAASRSRGAVSSDQFPGLLRVVQAEWDALARMPALAHGQSAIYTGAGRVVFPASVL